MKKYLCAIVLFCSSILSAGFCADCGFYEAKTSYLPSFNSITPEFNFAKPNWNLEIAFGYAFGNFIGLKENYAEVDLRVIPEPYGAYQPLGVVNVYRLSEGHWASSIGFGVRWWDSCQSSIWGVNLFYDYRKAHIGAFNRLGLGLELLGYEMWGECLDFRMNFYFPFSSEKSCSNRCINNPAFFHRERDFTYAGFDFELGAPLWRWERLEVEGAVGPYYYHQKELKNVFGGQARLGLSWTRYFLFEARVSCDNVFKTNAQGKVTLILPLFELLCGLDWDICPEPIARPIQRNGVIFTKFKEDWPQSK